MLKLILFLIFIIAIFVIFDPYLDISDNKVVFWYNWRNDRRYINIIT